MALDPLIQQILPNLPAAVGKIDYAAMRQQSDDMVGVLVGQEGPIPVASVEAREITGSGSPIPLRIYRPKTAVTGIMHFLHGGGWALGNLDIIDPVVRRLVRDLSMVVVASTYRLAPEDPFPAGFNDSMAAARWTRDHAEELGGANMPIVLGGESAGANVAAAIALQLAADGERNFDAQLLFYPAVDLRPGMFDRYPSRIANADPFLRAETLPHLFADYAGSHDPADFRISPLAAESVAGLPRAVIAVLTVDPLRDEGVAYAERLRAAGVKVELIEFDNLVHGFPGLAALVPAAAEATTATTGRLKSLLRDVVR